MLDTIKLNDKNKLVQVAKYISKYSGIGTATNTFDAKFELFIKKLQKENNLEDTGIIDKNTWTIMTKSLPTCSTSKNKNSIYTCAIQILLGGLTVDGIYGNKTKKAVAAYQAAAELEVDGICGPKTWNSLILKEEKDKEQDTKILNKCVKYLQWDSKWKKVKYSTYTSAQTIGNSGCGPASMAMILATWEDNKITPVQTCKEAVENGFRTKNNGTSWEYFKYVFKNHECFSKYIETNNVSTLMVALREGALAVCSMNSNDNAYWTRGGHFIVACGCDNDYIYANDPNKSETPRKQLINKFQKCMKQAFIFWPFKEEVESTPIENNNIINSTDEKNQINFDINLEGKIIDISKWQGKIDFKKLKPEIGLVIARASYRTEKDSKFDEYAKAMIENRIPFGVYCYSYAENIKNAKQEAQTLVSYAEQYNPLFYIMDAEEPKTTTDIIRAFAQELRARTTKKIGCYVAHHRYKTYKYDTLKNLFDITWIPCYGSNNGTISGSRKPSYDCDLWQYTSSGKIAGISGRVDLNIVMNEEHNLKWFLDIKEE